MQLGFWELAVILVIVLVLFGAGRLPEVFSALGQGVKKFREAQMDEPPATPEAPKQLAEGAPKGTPVEEAEEVPSKQAAGH
jgi:sec-independent protein translocase protein TatA